MNEIGGSPEDREFFAEVDAFIASLPEDSARVQRITDRLPERFHEVLRERDGHQASSPATALAMPSAADWSWGVIAAATAIAAALVGMVLIWLSAEPAGPGSGQAVVPQQQQRAMELEFVVTIHPDGEADITAEPRPVELAETPAKLAATDSPPAEVPAASVAAENSDPWYFRPARPAPVPELADPSWARTDIDRFILAALEARGTRPAPDADRATLLRRLSYDLTGLPPSPALVEHFLHNQSPAAYGSVVEELMATWQFGEHWGGRWLDLVGYDSSEPELWRYREYVIAALNKDKPFDRFVTEQLAGDLISLADVGEQAEARIGTGFLASADSDHPELLAERVAAVVMGVEAGADGSRTGAAPPLSPRDWQAMTGIFSSTRIDRGIDLRLDPERYPPANLVEDDRLRDESKRVRGLIASGERRLARASERREHDRMRRLRGEIADLRSELLAVEVAMRDQIVSSGSEFVGARDRRRPVNVGGVPRGVPQALAEAGVPAPVVSAGHSGRLELARWLVDPRHPLTARIFVDRIWDELFGRSLLGAPAGSGIAGEPPRHPDLLNFLAVKFSSDGWSVKRLVREMVMSRAYQVSDSEGTSALAVVDRVDGRLWGRAPRQLGNAELRDSVLAVAGWLSPAGAWQERLFARHEFGAIAGVEAERAYRTIYLKEPEPVGEGIVFEAAVAASGRMLETALGRDTASLVREVFINTLGRKPSSEERAWAAEVIGRAGPLENGGVLGSVGRPDLMGAQARYLEGLLPRVTVRLEAGVKPGDRAVSWAMLYHALMMSEEFRLLR